MLFAVDWIEIIIFLFIVGGSLIGQLFKVIQERAAEQKRKQRRPAPRPVAGADPQGAPPRNPMAGIPERGPANPPVADDKRTALEAEIEAFLKRSRQQRGGQGDDGGQPRRPDGGRRATRRGEPRPGRQTPQRAPVRAEVVGQRPPQVPAASRPDLAPEELEQPDHRSLRERLADSDRSLASDINFADERLESHLRQNFSHSVGELSVGQSATSIAEGTDAAIWTEREVQRNPLADQLLDLLSDPARIQAAVLAAEVLRRPSERWE